MKIQQEKENKKRELLKKKQAREKMEREQQEKNIEAISVANLEVPGELAYVLAKEQDWQPPHMDFQITAVAGSVMPFNWNPVLPPDIDAHSFSKYAGVFFKNNHKLGMTNKPIKEPFLQLLNVDKQHSLSIFKLILRFMCDSKMNDRKKKIISDYIIQKGLQNEPLRDEIYCQIANQTWMNHNSSQSEHGWLLMANCLSCIPPSQTLSKYLLKYVSDVGFKDYKEICQDKALQCMKIKPQLSRTYPPCLLEWKAALRKANMALNAKFPDEEAMMGHVESWTSCEQFAAHLLNQRNMFDNHSGWTVVLEEGSNYYELMGYDYILDLISEIEIIPGFPVCKSYSLVSSEDWTRSTSQVEMNSPHHPDRDRKMVFNERLPEPLPINALNKANPQQNRTNGRNDEMVFSASNPLNQRRVEEFLPALTDHSALNSRYYNRKLQVNPNIGNQANGFSVSDETMSDGVDGITLSRDSKLNGRHVEAMPEISASKLNNRYIQQQNMKRGSHVGSTSDNSEFSKWVDNIFEGALTDHNDSLNEVKYMENRIKGGGKILAQTQIPMPPLLHTTTIPANVNPPPILAPVNVTSPTIQTPVTSTALTNLDPAVQLAAAQMAVVQQQQQQAMVQAYINQMAQQQQQQQQQTLVQAALQQQQQQAFLQAALQQQQINQVAQPYLVLVQPDNTVAKTQVTMTTGQQQQQQLQHLQQLQQQQLQQHTNTKLMQQSQQITRQESSSSTSATSQNHKIINESQQSVVKSPVPDVTPKPSFSLKPPPPPVHPKPTPPPVSPKPKRTSSILLQNQSQTAAVSVSSPVIVNGTSTDHQVTVNELVKATESSGQAHKKTIPSEILVTSQREKLSINTSATQNGTNHTDITLDSPSESTGTSSLSSPSDMDFRRQMNMPTPAPPSPPVQFPPGTIRNYRANAVHIGKVIWPPPAEPHKKKEVQVGKLDINENLAQDITNITARTKSGQKWKSQDKPKDESIQTTLKHPQKRKSSKLTETVSHLTTLKALEKKFGAVANVQTETDELQGREAKSLQTETNIQSKSQMVSVDIPPAAPTYENVREIEPVKVKPNIDYSAFEGIKTKLYQTKRELFLTYQDVPWTLRLRKEVFSPKEKLEYAAILDLVFCQVIRDVYSNCCVRITKEECGKMRALLESHHITKDNYLQKDLTEQVKRIVVDTAKEWPTYFCRLFPIACGAKYRNVIYLGVNQFGVYLVTREKTSGIDQLKVVEGFSFEDIVEVVPRSPNILQLAMLNKGIVFYTKWWQQIKAMIDEYCYEHEQGSKFACAKKDYQGHEPTLLNFKQGDIIKLIYAGDRLDEGWLYGSLGGKVGFFPEEYVRHMERHEVVTTLKEPLYAVMMKDVTRTQEQTTDFMHLNIAGSAESHNVINGKSEEIKFMMLDYALQHFREAAERRMNPNLAQLQWTEKEQIEMVKWTQSPIQRSLLLFETPELNTLAVESFSALMSYMTDLPLVQKYTDVDCAMRILKICHKYPELREEVYCQLCKQTTYNRSINSMSLIRGWRFFSLFTAYNDCSEMLRPYLTKYLENSAMESSSISSIADICLKNLRKTFRYGGRKNVPLRDEIEYITDGRMSKQHSFCYAGQSESSGMVQITSSTLVRDVIADLCSNLDVTDSVEIEEYALFLSINTNKPPARIHRLSRDEYLLDFTADLQRNQKAYNIMFQRTVWYFPLHQFGNEIYTQHMFLQCIHNYLEGYLLFLKNGALPKDSPKIIDIVVLASLLHQSSGHTSMPSIKDLKNLLPKPVIESKDIKPQQWLHKIHEQLKCARYPPHESKSKFIFHLSKWELFGSTFFKLKSIPPKIGECWLAVNKNGIQILSKVDHELLIKYEFNEILSTRIYRENSKVFLDMKLGNLMAQRISRLETDQCSDISSLIGQYIHVINRQRKKQGNAVRTPLFN